MREHAVILRQQGWPLCEASFVWTGTAVNSISSPKTMATSWARYRTLTEAETGSKMSVSVSAGRDGGLGRSAGADGDCPVRSASCMARSWWGCSSRSARSTAG